MRRTLILTGIVLDAAAVFAAMALASLIKFNTGIFPGAEQLGWGVILPGAVVSIPYWLVVFGAAGCYTLHWDRSWNDEMRMVVKPVTVGMLILGALTFAVASGFSPGRWVILLYYILMLALVFTSRSISRLVEKRMAVRGRLFRNAIVVGTGRKALDLTSQLSRRPNLGYRILGYVRADKEEGVSALPPGSIIWKARDLGTAISELGATEILVTLASNFHDDILSLLLPAAGSGVRVKVVPDLFDVIAGHVHNSQILGEQLMEIMPERLTHWQKLVKTVMDLVVSLVVVTAGMPVWFLVAVAVKLDSRGPVFYAQERMGRGGKLFRIIKFRSMVADAEKHTGPVWAGRNDSRITRVGAFLRKSHLDEIPQFLNVLAGDMSIVGPRPERPKFVEELRRVYPFFDKRHTMKPGITGWAQVKLEYVDTVENIAERLKCDFYYMENQSIFLDLEIILRTLVVMITGKGAH